MNGIDTKKKRIRSMHKIIEKKTCNDIHMKVLVHSIEFADSLFFTQNNYNNPRRGCLLFRTICITVFFPTF